MQEIDTIVLGAGPAGISAASKLKSLGRSVVVVTTRSVKGALQIETIPNLSILEYAFPEAKLRGISNSTYSGISFWTGDQKNGPPVNIVDRIKFDASLLLAAASANIQIHEIGKDEFSVLFDGLWHVSSNNLWITSRFLIDATGRNSTFGKRQELVPWKQVALQANVSVRRNCPVLWTESLSDGWLWTCTCEPGNLGMVTFFTDLEAVNTYPQTLLQDAIRSSRLALKINELQSQIYIRDVTPAALLSVFEDNRISLGDAAIAKDPLGSQGLSTSISDGISAAIAINAIILGSCDQSLAINFLENRHRQAVKRHRNFLFESYAEAPFNSPFWRIRKQEVTHYKPVLLKDRRNFDRVLVRSSNWTLKDLPVLNGDNIESAKCLCSEEETIRWLFGFPIDTLIPIENKKETVQDIHFRLSNSCGISPEMSDRIISWMIANEVWVYSKKNEKEIVHL